jgi:predicted N-formylglutamate amidohydrolase
VRYLVTCEHGGNRVPLPFRPLFRGAGEILSSHRGWDPGALPLARGIARELEAPLRYSSVTRLLVDPNRSEESPTLLSEFSRKLDPRERADAIRRYHRRYRSRVRRLVEERSLHHTLLHLSVHTFTPVMDGRPRRVGIGILFDPLREGEARLAEAWIPLLRREMRGIRVEANQPYHGADDGLTTTFRRSFPPCRYLGMELEVRQDLAQSSSPGLGGNPAPRLAATLREAAREMLLPGPMERR